MTVARVHMQCHFSGRYVNIVEIYIPTLLNKAYIDADSELHLLVIYGALTHFTQRSGFYVIIIQNEMLSET